MAKVKIQGHASGTGVFTLTSPNSNTDRTITLPDGTGTLAFTTGDDDKLPLAGGTLTGDLNFGDNVKARFGTGNDLEIYHSGSHSIINETGDGYLVVQTNGTGMLFQKGTTEDMAKFLIDGAVELYHNNVKKFETTADGIKVTDRVTGSGDLVLATVDSNEKIHMDSDGYIKLETNGSERMRITSDGNVGLGTTTPPERLSIHEPSTGTGTYLPVAITGSNYATGYGVGISFKTENGSPTQKAKAAIIAEGTGEGYNKTSLHIAMSNTGDTTTEVALANSVLEFTMDGRGLSQFTAKSWIRVDMSNMHVPDSFGFSSVTDVATGQARCNHSNTMSNSSYNISTSAENGSVAAHSNINTTSFYLRVSDQTTGNAVDADYSMALVFGD